MKSVIVGTAGHIDHGKTALVKALTGIDADRLEEEKRRGITIDIGFAHLQLPTANGETLRLGFVDVPGHERFIRNMLAGIGGIDLVLLVIAADEGIKPQTREHFDICRLLGIRHGIAVLTKSDSVDADTLEVVRLEVEDFLRGSFLDSSESPIIAISSLTGAGMDNLKSALVRLAAKLSARDSNAIARLPIDRVFTMKGFGTVVTGTLISGTIRTEDELELFPSRALVRARGVQVHGEAADRATAGERTALNITGASLENLSRGMMLAAPGTFHPTTRVDVSLSLLPNSKPLKDCARVHFHAYTTETVAEVRLYSDRQAYPGTNVYAQLKLTHPALLLPGDRFILRQLSPVVTIGGGSVLDAFPLRKMSEQKPLLKTLSAEDPSEILRLRVARRGSAGITPQMLIAETGFRAQRIEAHLADSVRRGDIIRLEGLLVHGPNAAALCDSALKIIDNFHKSNPLVAGMPMQELRNALHVSPEVFGIVVERLTDANTIGVSGDVVHLAGRGVVMKEEESESKKIIEQAFASAGLKVPSLTDVLAAVKVDRTRAQKIVTLLLRDKTLIKISEDLVFHHTALADLRGKLAALKATANRIDVGRFKDLTGVSRKYAIPLLEYLDRERITRRVGNERIIL